jgi:hypothetical protein
MPQAKVYQIERLKTKVRNAFENHRDVLNAQRQMEEAEFVNSKIPEIKEKTGAEKLKAEFAALEKKNVELQEKARAFMRKYAGMHKLKGDISYRFGSGETINPMDIDSQVEKFAEAHANRLTQKSKTNKELIKLRQLEERCLDDVVLTNDIEEAQKKVETLLKVKAPFVLETYKPTINLLEAPQPQAEE